MGWRFRRRIRLAPGIGLNVSKSGFSWSFGGSPFTVNVGKRGVYRTVGIPGTGFSHRSRVGGADESAGRAHGRPGASPTHDFTEGGPSAPEISSSSPDEFARRLTEAEGVGYWPLVAALAIFGFALSTGLVAGAWLVGGGAWAFAAWRRHHLRTLVVCDYVLDHDAANRWGAVSTGIRSLNQSQGLWVVAAQTGTSDWKRNAGATSIVKRSRVSVSAGPRKLESNVPVFGLDAGPFQMFLLPDAVLVRHQRRYRIFERHEISVDYSTTNFIETEPAPQDAECIGTTWKYLRKDGGPDRRFKDNVQYPIMRYAETAVRVGDYSFTLLISNVACATEAVAAFATFASDAAHADEGSGDASEARETVQRRPPEEILGVSASATCEEIESAFRRKASRIHPDRYLDEPAMRVAAEESMKALNEARASMRQRRGCDT